MILAGALSLLKKSIPVPVKDAVKKAIGNYYYKTKAKKILSSTINGPQWLGLQEMEKLCAEYTWESSYHYDDDSVAQRGRHRVKELETLIPTFSEAKDFLEMGCGDGMVSAFLADKGKQAIGIDWFGARFDPRALNSKAKIYEMDAQAMSFPDNSFDVIFSYDSFEHFPRPDLVLKETYRLLRKGGYMYHEFGHLYPSPYGLHAYRSVPVPYCQFLFKEETIKEYIVKHNKPEVSFSFVNPWSAKQFKELWKEYEGKLEILSYKEFDSFAGMKIIEQYPACFTGKYDIPESLFTDGVQILLKKVN
jgi:ubiquinone/menaquinone biosynthesis C-methylase UbiE